MATTRLRAVFLLFVLALVLTTTGCRDAAAGRTSQAVVVQQPVPVTRGVGPQSTGFWEPPLARPLRVTRRFSPPPAPYAAGHRGVDLAGSPGQQVFAAGSGTVTWAGLIAGRGVVVVAHGRLRTTYEPVAADVMRGQSVHAGDRLGGLQPGHPGCPVAACLHWGLLRGSQYLDPLALLRVPVRLLPLGSR